MRYCIHSEQLTDTERQALATHGMTSVALPRSRVLSRPVCDHPDLSLFLCDGIGYTTGEHAVFLKERIPSLPLFITSSTRGTTYPEEAALCILTVGHHAFFRAKSTPSDVLHALEARGYLLHGVRQGYAACTVMPLDPTHAITADLGMARAMEAAGIEVLTIGSGGILLPPYPYGFIGGVGGVCDRTLYTLGRLDRHPDASRIYDLIGRLGMRAVSLSDGMLRDCGRLLFFEDDL